MPARRGRADQRLVRQFAQARGVAADQGIARVLARQECRQRKPGRQKGRKVFRRMHGDIDGAGEQSLLDFLGEQTFAADLRQRPLLDRLVLDLVAGGADDLDSDGLRRHAARLGNGTLRLPRLDQRQRRTARANAEKESWSRGLPHRNL